MASVESLWDDNWTEWWHRHRCIVWGSGWGSKLVFLFFWSCSLYLKCIILVEVWNRSTHQNDWSQGNLSARPHQLENCRDKWRCHRGYGDYQRRQRDFNLPRPILRRVMFYFMKLTYIHSYRKQRFSGAFKCILVFQHASQQILNMQYWNLHTSHSLLLSLFILWGSCQYTFSFTRDVCTLTWVPFSAVSTVKQKVKWRVDVKGTDAMWVLTYILLDKHHDQSNVRQSVSLYISQERRSYWFDKLWWSASLLPWRPCFFKEAPHWGPGRAVPSTEVVYILWWKLSRIRIR